MFVRSLCTALASLALGICSTAVHSATLTGTMAWPGGLYSISAVSSDLQDPSGTRYSDLDVMLICVDVTAPEPQDGPVTFESNAGASALKGGSGALGVAAIHWLIDQYYDSHHKNGNSQQQWAFQYALWEIGNDFNGQVSSIDPAIGYSHPLTDGDFAGEPDFVAAYELMYAGLVNILPTLSPSYRSTTYTLDLFNNAIPTEQSMVAIVERAPTPVTPGTVTAVPGLQPWALGLLALLTARCVAVRRRRGTA